MRLAVYIAAESKKPAYMKNVLFILIILACSNFAMATEQMPDYLYYENKKLALHTGWGHPSPLQTYYSQNNLDYPFAMLSTANYRGHVAIWKIVDNKLYLKEIKIREELYTPKEYNISSKADSLNRNNSVFADWFSGMITCREKENSYYFYVRYGEVLNIQILSKKDYKKISKITEKDTSNHKLMDKYYMLVLNDNYISYYFRLNEEDDIIINSKKGRFTAVSGYSPILEFFSNDHMKWPYNWENFEKNGAPNCRWSVSDNNIYLDEIYLHSGTGFYEIRKDSIKLEDIFSYEVSNNTVFASWLNGVYTIKHGAEKEDPIFPALKKFTPTEFVYLRIENGVIIESYTVPGSFDFRDISEDIEPGLKRILDELK